MPMHKRGIALGGGEPESRWSGGDTRHENLESLGWLAEFPFFQLS
jgi:hypothetical protein